MAKQTINVGQAANDKKGDSLRAAFQKVNSNFTELYTQLGLIADPTLNLGAFEFTGSTMSTTDSTAITIDQSVIVGSDLTVSGDILPGIANGGNLGSAAKPFKSLYVSNNTVFLGGIPLSLDSGTNELKINNIPISQTITYEDIPNTPTDVSDLTDNQGLLGNGGSTGNYSFDGNILQADEATIRTNDGDLNIESDSDVFVRTSLGNINENVWKFDTNGKLELPRGAELWEDALIGAVNQDLFLGTKYTPQVSAECAFTLGNTFIADIEFNDDITVVQIGWTVNVGGTDYTVTAIDLVPPPNQYRILVDGATFVEGETYTFTNPAAVSKGWFIRQGTGTLVSDVGGAILSSETFNNGEGQTYRDFSVELATPDGLNEHRWTFTNDGHLTVPGNIIFPGSTARIYGNTDLVGLLANPEVAAGLEIAAGSTVNLLNEGNVVISSNWGLEGGTKNWTFKPDGELQLPSGGDIVDSAGNSVLGGAPTIPNTVKGFINLVGDRPNNSDDIAFEAVVVRGNYAYVLGSDYYILDSDNRSKVYKFDLRTGEQVWVKQIGSGKNATFNISVGEGLIVIDLIATAGVGYKAGEEIKFKGGQIGGSDLTNDFIIIADTVDADGVIQTASVKAGYNAGALSGTYNGIYSYYDDARGNGCTIGYDDFNNKIVVVSQHESGLGDTTDNYWSWANVYVIDPVTGDVNQTVTLSDNADIYPNSIATYDAVGGVAIAGEKFGEYTDFGAITLLAGYNGYFDVLKSEIDAEHYPGSPIDNYYDFWVTGTGISNMENVDDVNYYTNLPTTVREGSGATFNISDNGDGTYGYSETISAGTNYLTGHKIKILGTSLGGATPANDCIITITNAVDGAVSGVSLSGTAAGGSFVLYSGVSGTNYNVGSGATFYIRLDADTGVYSYQGIFNQGLNYVAGDVITIPGTSFANGATPANDVTLTVASVDGLGRIGDISSTTGAGQTNALRIFVNGVDFSVEGSWSMKQNLGGEAFVWTPAWNKAIGGPTGDRFYDICYSEDGSALYAVGRGRYDVTYDQALVVKYNAANGTILWSKDIKFTEAGTDNREARAVCTVPGSTDIIVAGMWYNGINTYTEEIILTRITAAGVAVWQKTYMIGAEESTVDLDYEINIKAVDGNFVVSFEQSTLMHNRGIGMLVVDATGAVIRHRVLSSDGNSTYNYYNTPTANFADIYSDATGDYQIFAGYTYIPTDNYYNALITKMPVDGLFPLSINDPWNIGEHILNRFDVLVTTVTSAFESFTPTEHTNTITNLVDQRDYTTRPPAGLLRVFTEAVTKDSQGYLEFGDGSRQSFATNIIPQIRGANDYYLTTQDSGKHIFFEHENGVVYIPHNTDRMFPVGFTFTIVNTTNSDCWLRTQSGSTARARLKLAGRNIDTVDVGIPDSGSGTMVTVMKIKDGYTMDNSDGDGDYPDIWIVSGPGDLYNND